MEYSGAIGKNINNIPIENIYGWHEDFEAQS